jgi:hypothetical protein
VSISFKILIASQDSKPSPIGANLSFRIHAEMLGKKLDERQVAFQTKELLMDDSPFLSCREKKTSKLKIITFQTNFATKFIYRQKKVATKGLGT